MPLAVLQARVEYDVRCGGTTAFEGEWGIFKVSFAASPTSSMVNWHWAILALSRHLFHVAGTVRYCTLFLGMPPVWQLLVPELDVASAGANQRSMPLNGGNLD